MFKKRNVASSSTGVKRKPYADVKLISSFQMDDYVHVITNDDIVISLHLRHELTSTFIEYNRRTFGLLLAYSRAGSCPPVVYMIRAWSARTIQAIFAHFSQYQSRNVTERGWRIWRVFQRREEDTVTTTL